MYKYGVIVIIRVNCQDKGEPSLLSKLPTFWSVAAVRQYEYV